jgi:hypothetical protein
MRKLTIVGLLFGGIFFHLAELRAAGLSFAPYISIKSTKNVTPGASSNSESEKINQRQEYGIRAALKMGRWFKSQLSVGQSQLTTTEKVSLLKDEYEEIDFSQEFEMDTSDPDNSIKMTETQRLGKFSLIFDPSFSIFIARLQVGVTARQRIVKIEQTGQATQENTFGPSFYPHSGAGLGVRLFRGTFIMAEYQLLHYSYPPDLQPFERELTVSYSISI